MHSVIALALTNPQVRSDGGLSLPERTPASCYQAMRKYMRDAHLARTISRPCTRYLNHSICYNGCLSAGGCVACFCNACQLGLGEPIGYADSVFGYGSNWRLSGSRYAAWAGADIGVSEWSGGTQRGGRCSVVVSEGEDEGGLKWEGRGGGGWLG